MTFIISNADEAHSSDRDTIVEPKIQALTLDSFVL